jgi:cobalt-zinc-cadmium efflux system outer membrane protein
MSGNSQYRRVSPCLVFGFLLGISLPPGAGAAPRPQPAEDAGAGVLGLDRAVALALDGNPGLAEIRARAQAAAAVPPQAGSLPDPMVGFNALNLPVDSFDRRQEAMTQMQFGISQELPFPGKLALKEKAAGFEAEAAGSSVEETRLRLISDVKVTWWRLFYVDRSLEIINRNQDLLRQFVEIAQTKYKVGEGLQQDVLLAQVELSQLMDRALQLEGTRRNDVARLNALLHQPANTPVVLPEKVAADLPDLLPGPKLFQMADEARPRLAKSLSELHAADARLELARKDRLPDFQVGALYGFRGGDNPDGSSRDDFASFRFNMSVPLYASRKQNRAIDQRSSERLAQRYALEDERVKVQADISAALADYEQAREQALLFETGIIPQARQTVASMLAGYQVNKVDFLNLVRSQITLYNHETRYWQALSEAQQALAELSAAVGREVIHE